MKKSLGKLVCPWPKCILAVCCNFLFNIIVIIFINNIIIIISWCAVLMNMAGQRDPVAMRVLSDFYGTAATGAGLFTCQTWPTWRRAVQQHELYAIFSLPRANYDRRSNNEEEEEEYRENLRYRRGSGHTFMVHGQKVGLPDWASMHYANTHDPDRPGNRKTWQCI